MALYKNRKGIIHSLDENDQQVVKWVKDGQLKPLNEKEAKAYADAKASEIKGKSSGKSVKREAVKPQANPSTVAGAEENKPDQPLSEIDQLRAKYVQETGEEPDKKWNAATLTKKLGELAPQ